jgi:DNA-binding response OmpR family regulator
VRALVVEDQPKLASLSQRGVSEEGYAVDVAPDGAGALVRATATEYDVIVLDVMLPGSTGSRSAAASASC